MGRTRRRGSAGAVPALVAVVLLGASACAGAPDDGAGPASSSEGSTEQPDADRTSIELAVLDALADDPHLKEARHEPGEDRVVVTVRTQGAPLAPDERRDLEERAEQVTDGIDVVVVTTDEDAPTED